MFESYIWDVNEESIDDSDVKTVQRLLASDVPSHVACRLIFWERWNTEKYGVLNIRLLLNHLTTLDDNALSEFMEKVWSQKVARSYVRGEEEKNERWQMINSLEELIDDEKIKQYKDFHNLFELLLYMCGCSEIYAQKVYMQYQRKFCNKQQVEDVLQVTQSNKLVFEIEKMKSML